MAVIHKLFSKKGRAAIYAIAATALSLAVVLGLIDNGSETLILENISKGIGIVASILALLNLTPDEDAPVEGE